MVIISCKKSIEDRLNDGCFASICYDSLFVFQGSLFLCSLHLFSHYKITNVKVLLLSTHLQRNAKTPAQFHETQIPSKPYSNPSFPHISCSNPKHYCTQQTYVKGTTMNENKHSEKKKKLMTEACT
jgi:hypothetical protein